MVAPDWLPNGGGSEVTFSVPDGPAWTTVLKLAHNNVAKFKAAERLFLLGLIEDATQNVSWWEPDIAGAADVAGIALFLLSGFDNYRSLRLSSVHLRSSPRFQKETRIASGRCFEGRAPTRRDDRDRISSDFQEIIFAGMQGLAAARDLPDVVIETALDYILLPEGADGGDDLYTASTGVERYFGVREGLSISLFPWQRARGPWLHLFRYHPSKALRFALRVFNQSARAYVHSRYGLPLELASEVELTFSDGKTCRQWCNGRLWNLYRGFSVGPYVLQSILMAMEKWLLGYAEGVSAKTGFALG